MWTIEIVKIISGANVVESASIEKGKGSGYMRPFSTTGAGCADKARAFANSRNLKLSQERTIVFDGGKLVSSVTRAI